MLENMLHPCASGLSDSACLPLCWTLYLNPALRCLGAFLSSVSEQNSSALHVRQAFGPAQYSMMVLRFPPILFRVCAEGQHSLVEYDPTALPQHWQRPSDAPHCPASSGPSSSTSASCCKPPLKKHSQHAWPQHRQRRQWSRSSRLTS